MKAKARFVNIVGKCPFPGRHDVLEDYEGAVRAARAADAKKRDAHSRSIGKLARTNTKHAVEGAVTATGFAIFALAQNSWLYAGESLASLTIGAAFGASALAQRIIQKRADELPLATNPVASVPAPVQPESRWSRLTGLEVGTFFTGIVGALALDIHLGIMTVSTIYNFAEQTLQ